jgi:integrase/recombinase XerC
MSQIELVRISPPSQSDLNPSVLEHNHLWAEFGQLKIADSTRKQYVKAIEHFCLFAYNGSATPETISRFLALDQYAAIDLVLRYRRHSIEQNLAPSTINVRLAAIKSLVGMARRRGQTKVELSDIESIKSETYRDTRGVSVEQFQAIGVRDYALMLLFWSNALRRGEIASANIEDFLPQQQQLMILGKGKRAKVAIDLTDGVTSALERWLNFHPFNVPGQPLFISLSHNCYGARISGDSIYRIVQGYAEAAGIDRRVSPHRIRHSSITAFLDASDGNIRAAQALSRHSQMNTLTLYDDNRQQQQKGASGVLEGLLESQSL